LVLLKIPTPMVFVIGNNPYIVEKFSYAKLRLNKRSFFLAQFVPAKKVKIKIFLNCDENIIGIEVESSLDAGHTHIVKITRDRIPSI